MPDFPTEITLDIVGASCGAAHERTTAVLLERREVLHRNGVEDYDEKAGRWRVTTTFRVRDVRRLGLGATLPELAKLITALSLDAEIAVVDVARVGLHFVDHLKGARKIVPIVPFAQPKLSRRQRMVFVPERDLGGVVVTKQERLTFGPGLGDRETLLRALVTYTPREAGGRRRCRNCRCRSGVGRRGPAALAAASAAPAAHASQDARAAHLRSGVEAGAQGPRYRSPPADLRTTGAPEIAPELPDNRPELPQIVPKSPRIAPWRFSGRLRDD
jgi:hypothetical protein